MIIHARWLRLLAVFVGFSMLAAACGDDDDTATPDGNDGGSASGDAITFAVEQEPVNLNSLVSGESFSQYIMLHVWPGAFTNQPDGSFELNTDLLTSAEITSEDPQIVEYEIDPDAVWSDGEPIDADDFIAHWVAQRGTETSDETDPETGEPLPLYTVQSGTGYDTIETIEGAADGKSFTVTFSQPFADWQILWQELYPEHYFTSVGDGDHAVGWNKGFVTENLPDLAGFVSGGPYTISDFTSGESMTLVANENYWGEAPETDTIVMPFVENATEQPAAMDNGEVDVIFPQAQIDLLDQIRDIDDANHEVGFGTFFEFLIINHENVHLQNTDVRKAMALAVDREQIVERILHPFDDSVEVLNNRFFFPSDPRYQDNGSEYDGGDPDGARELLEAAGYTEGDDGIYVSPEGERLSLRLGWRDPNERREDSLDLIQAQLAEAGIAAELDPNEDFEQLLAGNFDVFIVGQTSTGALVDNNPLYVTGAGFNAGNYSNPDLDDVLARAGAELDADTRTELYQEADEILWEDMALLPLFQNPEIIAWLDRVSEVSYNGYDGPTWNMPSWGLS